MASRPVEDYFAIGKWLSDANSDGLPDDVWTRIILAEGVSAEVASAAAELAARLGHETMALTLPIVGLDRDLDAEPTDSIIVGQDNRWLNPTVLADPTTSPADGVLRLPDGQLAIIGDDQTVAAALRRIARHVSDESRASADADRLTVGESSSSVAPASALDLATLFTADGLLADTDGDLIPDTVRATVVVSPDAGPAERAEAGNIAARLGLESIGLQLPLAGPHPIAIAPLRPDQSPTLRVVATVDNGPRGITVHGAVAARWLAGAAPGANDHSHPLTRTVEQITTWLAGDDMPPPPEIIVWEENWALEWEVDEVRRLFRDEVIPYVRPNVPVHLDIRISEPATVRFGLQHDLTARLTMFGVTPIVTVGSAYKPGVAWLTDEVAFILRGIPDLHEVVIRFRDFRRQPGEEWLNPRIVKELSLIDETAAVNLAARLAEQDFTDRWLEPPLRWLMELYPVDEMLPVPRERVRFEFDAEQEDTYVVLARNEGGTALWQGSLLVPTTERPYLDAYPDLGLVHPPTGWFVAEVGDEIVLDQRIPTDLERIWDRYQAEILPRIAAHVRERTDGSPRPHQQPFFSALEIHATVSEPDEALPVRQERISALETLHEELYFTTLEYLKELGRRESGVAFDAPGQVIPWVHDGSGGPPVLRWTLKDFADPAHMSDRALVDAHSGSRGVRVVGVELNPESELKRAEIQVELPSAAAQALALSRVPRLGALPIETRIEFLAPDASPVGRLLPPESAPHGSAALAGVDAAPRRRDSVVSYDAHLAMLRGLAQLPGVRLWRAGRSFRGRDGWVAAWSLPNGGEITSHAKQIAWKPTLLINARHHGNEPSSTVSSLQMIEWVANHPAWEERRRRINLVVVPFENLDGGELAWEMQQEHPQWMLHAGRFSALGLEMRHAYGNPAHPSSESRVLPRVWRHWLPDLLVDDHGFPSHEWVQPFSGYIPLWPAYWLPRGLSYAYLKYVDDPAYPDHQAVAARLRALMVEETRNDEEVLRWNVDWANRYATYANRWLPEAFPFIEHEGLLVYFSPTRPNPGGRWEDWATDFSTLYPWITTVAFVTEIADETAQGDYMDLCARAHEALDIACVRLLAEADHRFTRRRRVGNGGVSLWAGRQRPVVPSAER